LDLDLLSAWLSLIRTNEESVSKHPNKKRKEEFKSKQDLAKKIKRFGV
jgi:hypothetical protein